MNIIQLYEDYGIDYKTEGHKHCREGWVNIPCPFCTGNPGYHLGFPLDGFVFKCYRCGKHGVYEVISKLLSVSTKEAKQIVTQYSGKIQKPVSKPVIKSIGFKLPSGLVDLQPPHRRYLTDRGFDPQYLRDNWEIMGTGPLSFLSDGKKQIDYKHRIFIPIFWKGKMVSFQTRSIKKNTEHGDLKYIACPKNREIIHHKDIIYAHRNWEKIRGETGIVVEGVTDVWKLGENAVATFGIEYKPKQVNILAKAYKRIAVVFDEEPQARRQAKKLVEELTLLGVDAWWVPIDQDPGSMTKEQARKLVNKIIHY